MREALLSFERGCEQFFVIVKIPNAPFPAIDGVSDFVKFREILCFRKNIFEHFCPGIRRQQRGTILNEREGNGVSAGVQFPCECNGAFLMSEAFVAVNAQEDGKASVALKFVEKCELFFPAFRIFFERNTECSRKGNAFGKRILKQFAEGSSEGKSAGNQLGNSGNDVARRT